MKKLFVAIAMICGLVCTALLPFNVSATSNPEPYLVKDIYSGTYEEEGEIYPNDSNPYNITNFKSSIYFSAYDETHGSALWKSDGTADGTVMVKVTDPTGEGDPSRFMNINGTLFFVAYDNVHGNELWKSDGTADGTFILKDITPDGGTQFDHHTFTNVNGTLFFTTQGYGVDGLWKSDGTTDGTVKVIDDSAGIGWFLNTTNFNGTLFFVGCDSGTGDYELWKSDGTAGGTVMVKNLNSNIQVSNQNFTVVNDTLYFRGVDSDTGGTALWRSDGTADGTVMVKTINPTGRSWDALDYFTDFNDTLYFIADDGTNGVELWESDGTADGTVMVKDINPAGDGIHTNSGSGSAICLFNGKLLLSADNGMNGVELWESDGTTGGTVMLKDINPDGGSFPDSFVELNGVLYFGAEDGTYGYELWESDGTTDGTMIVDDINPNEESWPYDLTVIGDTLFFGADDGTHGYELWAYDLSTDDSTLPTFTNLPGLVIPINLTDGQVVSTNPYVINVKPEYDTEVDYVEFYVDGVLICTDNTADSNGIYSCNWDTSLYHSDIQVIAVDTTGNRSVALNRTVTVNLGNTLPNTGTTAWTYLLGLLPLAGILALKRKQF